MELMQDQNARSIINNTQTWEDTQTVNRDAPSLSFTGIPTVSTSLSSSNLSNNCNRQKVGIRYFTNAWGQL